MDHVAFDLQPSPHRISLAYDQPWYKEMLVLEIPQPPCHYQSDQV